jgi:tRNA A-37 threonylcarbamoyl transferase component Bud32
MMSARPPNIVGLEACLEAFETAWRGGPRPMIAAFWRTCHPPADPDERRELLLELIQVDLEYRWRSGKERGRRPGARGPHLEWYNKQFAELGSLDALPLALVAEEYRVRRRWGDNPSHAEYAARFPRGGLFLIELLAGVDVALADEGLSTEATAEPLDKRAGRIPFDPDAPLTISDYALKRQIGAGGMCKVYTAVQMSLDKPVAVKVLRKERLASELAVQRFRREARLTASLKHSGIVDVHGLGRLPGGGYFMVLDLVVGQDLSRLGIVPPPRAGRILASLAEILSHVHETGIIHCDLKPANVLVDAADNVFLTDFGLARRFGGGAPETVFDDHPAGTLAYMAPEQIDSRFGAIGPWTDVYGLGGILHTLLFGQPPFVGSVEEAHFPLSSLSRRCLCQDPVDRWKSVAELLDALRHS